MAGIIDGDKWLEQRIRFLREHVDDPELTEDQRTLLRTELDHLEAEAAAGKARFRRWLLFGGRRQP